MPAKPRWWRHIPEIRWMLAEARLPVIDRAAVQRLFGLERRQAIALLHRLGGFQAGRTFLISREQLIVQLDALAATGEYQQEAARRERVAAAIEGIERRRQTEAARILVSREVFDSRIQNLEPGVRLGPGKLEIEFAGPEDLLRKLFGLAQAVAHDYAGFEQAAGGGGGRERIPA